MSKTQGGMATNTDHVDGIGQSARGRDNSNGRLIHGAMQPLKVIRRRCHLQFSPCPDGLKRPMSSIHGEITIWRHIKSKCIAKRTQILRSQVEASANRLTSWPMNDAESNFSSKYLGQKSGAYANFAAFFRVVLP
jgi:hypothetical protein